MKILYITQYFAPEIGATTNRALANVRYLASKGHQVTVLTEMPNHPHGIIFPEYKRRFYFREKMENFFVERVWVYTNPKKNFITRMLFYITFATFGSLRGIITGRNYDVVYVTSPPLFVGIIGKNIKKIFPKIKFIFEVRDLWPDAAIEMGQLNNKSYRKFSYKLEASLYEKADHIVAVTNRFKKAIIDKGVCEDKISVLRNGSDLSFRPVKISQEFKNIFRKENEFIAIYAGNLGIAQNLKTLIEAANILKNENVKIILAGTGPEEVLLHNYKKEISAENVIFTGEISKEKMSDYFAIADCGIIPLKKIKVFERTIPSKLFDYMSANLPIILGVKGEAKEILIDSKAGIFFEPENAMDLAEKILYLKNNPQELQKMKLLGREYIKTNFDRYKLASKLDDILRKVK